MREILFIFLALLGISAIVGSQTCTKKTDVERFDCFPEDGSNEKDCLSRGCCWNPRIQHRLPDSKRYKHTSGDDMPYCFFPDDFPNYRVVSTQRVQNGHIYSIQKSNSTFRPNEILKLEARVTFDNNQRLRVQIVDPNNPRYQVPDFETTKQQKIASDNTDYQIAVSEDPFSIKVYRKSTARLMLEFLFF